MNAAYLTPAITLFHEDGTLDFESQEHLFNNLIESGVDGAFAGGNGLFRPLAEQLYMDFQCISRENFLPLAAHASTFSAMVEEGVMGKMLATSVKA